MQGSMEGPWTRVRPTRRPQRPVWNPPLSSQTRYRGTRSGVQVLRNVVRLQAQMLNFKPRSNRLHSEEAAQSAHGMGIMRCLINSAARREWSIIDISPFAATLKKKIRSRKPNFRCSVSFEIFGLSNWTFGSCNRTFDLHDQILFVRSHKP